MRGKKELLLLIAGPILFILDLASDILVAVNHWSQGDKGWFDVTIIFIIIPLFIVSLLASYQTFQTNKRRRKDDCINLFLLFSCLSIFDRYVQEFKHWKKIYWNISPCGENYKECNCPDCKQYRETVSTSNESAYHFAWIRFAEAVTESAPQWCLQVYIMLRRWSFPWYTLVSTVLSLFSLAWSVTSLEKARATKDGQNFTWKATGLHFVSQLFVLLSRLSAITVYAYATKELGFLGLANLFFYECVVLTCITCGYMTCKPCCSDVRCCDLSLRNILKKVFLSFLCSFFVSESVLQSLGVRSICIRSSFFVARSLENIFLVTFVALFSGKTKKPISLMITVTCSLVGVGTFFAAILLVVRHVLRPKEVPVDNRNIAENEAQLSNAFHPTKSEVISATNSSFVL